MIEFVDNLILFWLLTKLLSLLIILSNGITKFANYNLYYKKKFISNQTQTFVYKLSIILFE